MNNVLVVGALYNGKGDIVDEIVSALRQRFKVDWFDPGLYLDTDLFARRRWRRVNLIDNVPCLHKYKYAIFISGGFIPSKRLLNEFKKNSTHVISWQLSDPDDCKLRGVQAAENCDLIITNSLESAVLYKKTKKTLHLEFAANKRIEAIPEVQLNSDYVVIGECRKDRLSNLMLMKDLKGELYGRGWSDIPHLRKNLTILNEFGSLVGEEKFSKITSTKVYISFGRTMAGGNNLKVGFFEALSVGAIIVTDSNLTAIQNRYGIIPHVFNFNDAQSLYEICKKISLLKTEEVMGMKRANLDYFNEKHSWFMRISEIENFLGNY
jgi:hypothetical protein